MLSHTDDRDANLVPSHPGGVPSRDPPSQSSESSVRKKHRRSKLGAASKRAHRQITRSSRGLLKKAPGTQDNTYSRITQGEVHDVPPESRESRATACDTESTASSKTRGPRHSHKRPVEKRRSSGTSGIARAGSSSAAERLSLSSSLGIPPGPDTQSPKTELRESSNEVDRPAAQAHGNDDVPHEAPKHITRTSHGSSMPSATATLTSPSKAASPTTSLPEKVKNARGSFAANNGGGTPTRHEKVRDSINSPKVLTSAKSETAGHVTATTDQQPETALRDMANLPTLLDRLLNPLRKRAYFGSVTLRVLSPRSTPSLTPTPRKHRTWSFSTDDKWPQIAVGTILVVATVLVIYSLFQGTSGTGGGDTSGNSPTLCQTSDCIRHADLFAHWLNSSIDPCEDFSAFVCSAWAYGAQYRRGESTTLRQEIVLDFTEQLPETITAGLT
ncbi:hypothetical protein HPB50_015230 [Hyalomma asiaticum]|uniref:Uncharacterized protein n=1 Tax=Hyalomma asiaticum TaxID=266040 RepID=A0ACB7SNU1_HYAAI|nr:hypothetical protein HPB50_015230 [Hyalomma asiaticum]